MAILNHDVTLESLSPKSSNLYRRCGAQETFGCWRFAVQVHRSPARAIHRQNLAVVVFG